MMIRLLSLSVICLAFVCMFNAKLDAAEPTKDTLDTVKKNVAEKKAILVDVREKDEWDEGHLKGATLLPYRTLGKQTPETIATQLPKGTIIYLYCAAGKRCLRAADILAPQGYDVRPLNDGYRDLLQHGFLKAAD